jgi:hypothetical protein
VQSLVEGLPAILVDFDDATHGEKPVERGGAHIGRQLEPGERRDQRFERGPVDPDAGGCLGPREGEGELALSARQTRQHQLARRFGQAIEAGRCAQPHLEAAPVHALDFPRPLMGTGHTGFTGETGHRLDSHAMSRARTAEL